MKSKKLLAIVVASSVILASASTAFALPISSVTSSISQVNMVKMPPVGDVNSSSEEASAKITKDQAKDIAKKVLKDYFETTIDDTFSCNVGFRPDYNGDGKSYVWGISWNLYNSQKNVNINVDVNAMTGKVSNINKNEYVEGQVMPSVATITQDQATEIAEKLINKLNAEEFKDTVKVNDYNIYAYGYNATNYVIRYARLVNGIMVDTDGITVDVDGVTGKVRGYNIRWNSNAVFPSLDGIISSDKALEAYKNNTKMNLSYIRVMDKYGYDYTSKDTRLVYTPDFTGLYMMDAKTGKSVEYNNIVNQTTTKDLNQAEKDEIKKNIVVTAPLTEELDKAKAEEIANNKIKDLYGDGYELQNISYQEYEGNNNNQKMWTANFNKKSNDAKMMYQDGGYISIDATTGTIISLSKYGYYGGEEQNFTPVLTWDEAYKKALVAVAKYYGDKFDQIKTQQVYYKNINPTDGKEIQQRQYYFTFPRVVNGALFYDNQLSVGFDAKTGEMIQLNSNWSNDMIFAPVSSAIPADEAMRSFFDFYKPQLSYTMVPKISSPLNKFGGYDTEAKLVYRLDSAQTGYPMGNIDAATGNIIDYNGEQIGNNSEEFYKAIKGNKYENQFKILAKQGVIDTKNFDLNKEVTKTDLIKMLVNVRGYRPYMLKNAAALNFTSSAAKDSVDYKYLQMAVMYGIIENKTGDFKGDEKITREDMAVYLVKFLGYDKLAQAGDIFVLNDADASAVSADKKGYIAIAKGLKLITDDADNKLRLKDNTNMEELAIGVYNALGNVNNTNYRYY